ncbi:MAG: helix-turn-helix transcriptional regulator [Lachnospiraceae bacterium]|nr:helix-turn-helix transcriptional regulator [Lachnospiraceae bacterium]MBQ8785965.1 helix-turn-helix transcriptional regulator [Alphaproteobacteria bacterium]
MYEKLKAYNNLYSVKERKELITESLKTYRLLSHLQQKEVAELIGINYQTYCSYENGRSEPPAEILVRLSKLYEIPVDVLVQVDNFNKDKNNQQAQLDIYKKEVEELKEKIAEADPQTKFALNMMLNQINKLIAAIENAEK